METVFIINPKSGENNNVDKLVDSIKEAGKRLDRPTKIYITKCVSVVKKL